MSEQDEKKEAESEKQEEESSAEESSSITLEEMPFLAHLDEMRRRIIRSVVAAFLGMLACYAFAEKFFDWLMLPLYRALPEASKLIYTAPHEAFFTYIKVAFVAGIILTSPYIFYQMWLFVVPGLYSHERKYIMPIAFCSALFFVCGAFFGYGVVFPYGYKFFMSFSDVYIQPMITMREGLSFAIRLLLAFGVVFELPLVIFFLARLGIVTSKGLRKQRKYAILIAFVLSAMLTPPDLVTQTFMSGPLIVLYELGIWVAKFFGKREKGKDSAKETASAEEGTK